MNESMECRPASRRQLWALKCATGIDYRGQELSMADASKLLSQANEKSGYVKSDKPKSNPNKYIALFDKEYDRILDEMVKEVESALGIKSVVEMEANGKKKCYAFFGGGCGFAFLKYRKSPKMEEYENYAKKVWRGKMENDIYKRIGIEKVAYLAKVGSPLGAILCQDMSINASYLWKVAEIAERLGNKSVDVKYWYD